MLCCGCLEGNLISEIPLRQYVCIFLAALLPTTCTYSNLIYKAATPFLETSNTTCSRAATAHGNTHKPRSTATRRAATLSGGSKCCACHTDRSRGPQQPDAPQPFLEPSSTAPATHCAWLPWGRGFCLCGRRSTWSLQKGAGAALRASRKGYSAPSPLAAALLCVAGPF